MGDRGTERPVYKPKGTTLTFQWPQGMPIGQREYVVRVASDECEGDTARMVVWLGSNAWRYAAGQKRPPIRN